MGAQYRHHLPDPQAVRVEVLFGPSRAGAGRLHAHNPKAFKDLHKSILQA